MSGNVIHTEVQIQSLGNPCFIPTTKIFLSMPLNMSNLLKLTNEPVQHNPTWTPIPTKLHSDNPKFKGNTGEDQWKHTMKFHLTCSSN